MSEYLNGHLLSIVLLLDLQFQIFFFFFKSKTWVKSSLGFLLSKYNKWLNFLSECQQNKTATYISQWSFNNHKFCSCLKMHFTCCSALLKGKWFFKISHVWSNPTQSSPCEDAAELCLKRIYLIKRSPGRQNDLLTLQEWNNEGQERSNSILMWGTPMKRKEKSHQETFHLLQDVLKLKGLHIPRIKLYITVLIHVKGLLFSMLLGWEEICASLRDY